jgi:hypothetical protein
MQFGILVLRGFRFWIRNICETIFLTLGYSSVLVTVEQGENYVELSVCSPGKFGFHLPTGQNCCSLVPTDPLLMPRSDWRSDREYSWFTTYPSQTAVFLFSTSLVYWWRPQIRNSTYTPGSLHTSKMTVTGKVTAHAGMHMRYPPLQIPNVLIVIFSVRWARSD